MIPSEWLHAFTVFAEDANLSRAAKRLALSQPAVHAQLRRLSELLGVPLYRRVGRGLALTREGIEVAAFARGAEERSREFVARLRGEETDRRIVVTAGAGALLHVIAEGLRAFARTYDGRLEFVTADAAAAVDATQSGAAHVGVAALGAAPDSLVSYRLAEVRQVLVMPRDHRLARRRRVRLGELAGERLVLPPAGRPQRAVLDAALAGVGVRVGAIASGWDVVLRLVELGVGIAVMNSNVPVPRGLLARTLNELPVVRYFVFTRPHPRADVVTCVDALVRHAACAAS
ncbi:MAG TPA: LysR family transcriptional regulator [Kofleriaceae bacterium]|nr:LysR family transcriptional regulator [Kofleriaceae bacterium]